MDATCVLGTLPCSLSLPGNLILTLAYGAIIAYGAKLIGDGGDLLMDSGRFSPAIIGCLVLPFLGALPDAAVILASGLGDDRAQVQEDLSVGLGVLAGSTIMLLTVAWSSSMWVGRCRLDLPEEAGPSGSSIATSGAEKSGSNAKGGLFLGCIRCGDNDGKVKFFVRSDIHANDGQFKRLEGVGWCRDTFLRTGVEVESFVPKTAVLMMCSAATFLLIQIPSSILVGHASTKVQRKEESWWALGGAIVAFLGLTLFIAYSLFSELAEDSGKAKEAQVKEKMTLHKLVRTMMRRNIAQSSKHAARWSMIRDAKLAELHGVHYGSTGETSALTGIEVGSESSSLDGDEDDETKSCPLLSAVVMMVVGTLICAVFSDPLVGAISMVGKKSGIAPFFVSAVVTPFCSNASELYASLKFAAAKQQAKNSVTFSQLYSAAIMNNTLALGVFCLLVHMQGLVWLFCTEVVATILVILIVGAIGFRTTLRTLWAPLVFAIYPLSLIFIKLAKPYLDPTV